MTPEQKCVSLETAKKLRDAGFWSDTERYYHMSYGNGETIGKLEYGIGQEPFDTDEYNIAAPDAQELGELLPAIPDISSNRFITTYKQGDEWIVFWGWNGSGEYFSHKNEAEARAAAWLWLKEQKLI